MGGVGRANPPRAPFCEAAPCPCLSTDCSLSAFRAQLRRRRLLQEALAPLCLTLCPVSVLRAGAWLPQAPATTRHAERHCPTLWKGRQEALVRWAPPRLPEAQRRLVPAGDKSRGPPLHLRLSPGGRHHVSFSPPSSTQPLRESSGSRGCWGPRQSLGCLRSRAAHRHVAFKKRNCLSYYFLKKFLHLLKKKTLKC